MKYLKLFENMFGPDEPRKIDINEWNKSLRSLGKDFFTKKERENLIELLESSDREHMTEEEWGEMSPHEKTDYYRIGLTYLSFYIPTYDLPTYDGGNPNPYEVYVRKCTDGWFLVSFYQGDWDRDEGYFEGYFEYYECDGFDCLLNLLKEEAKLK